METVKYSVILVKHMLADAIFNLEDRTMLTELCKDLLGKTPAMMDGEFIYPVEDDPIGEKLITMHKDHIYKYPLPRD